MPQHYGNKKKRRSGDPNLEPGVAAATRRSQRTRKVTPTIENRLVPNIGTPVPRRRVLEFPPAFETDFPYGRPVTPRIVTPKTVTPKTVTPKTVTPKIVTLKPTRKRTGTTKRRRR
jgi:hypothetical protein